MLIAMCVGNTSVSLGLFEKGRPEPALETISTIVPQYPTDVSVSYDKYSRFYAGKIRGILRRYGFNNESLPVQAVFCSVVPAVTPFIEKALKEITGKREQKKNNPVKITYRAVAKKMPLLVERPSAVGIDRLLAAYGGLKLFGGPLAVVDAGTALTVNFVSKGGGFLGGSILPGAGLMARSLHAGTAKLPEIKIKTRQKGKTGIPPSPIGKNTSSAVFSGIIYAMAGAVEKLLRDAERAMRVSLRRVVLTGGDSALLYSLLNKDAGTRVYCVEPALVLKGMRFITGMARATGEEIFSKADA